MSPHSESLTLGLVVLETSDTNGVRSGIQRPSTTPRPVNKQVFVFTEPTELTVFLPTLKFRGKSQILSSNLLAEL